MPAPVPRLYLIADAGRAARVEAALRGLPRGAAMVQLRDPALGARALLELARALLPACRAAGAPLLINDRADVALAAAAAGVHLPGAGLVPADARALLGPEALIGASCHAPDEVARAAREGADFCVFGPVWPTPGKGPAQGLSELARAARAAAGVPVLALGGVEVARASALLPSGAHGGACIRSVLDAADPAQAASALFRALGG